MAKWGDSSFLSVETTTFHPRQRWREVQCAEDGSNNVFLPLPADQSGLQNTET